MVIENINKTKTLFLKNINKINTPLVKLTNNRENMQIASIRNDIMDIRELMNIKKLIREYYEQVYFNKFHS